MYESLAVIAVFAFIYSTIAGGVEKTVISGPMIFVVFGLLFGPLGLGILSLDVSNTDLRMLADLTLAALADVQFAEVRVPDGQVLAQVA